MACSSRRASASKFSIGHRGAPLLFPEHTVESHIAAAQQGARSPGTAPSTRPGTTPEGHEPASPTGSESQGRSTANAPRAQPGSAPGSSRSGTDRTRPTSDIDPRAPRTPGSSTRSRSGTSPLPGGAGSAGGGGGASGGAGGEEAGPPDGFKDQAAADRADWLEGRMSEFIDTLIPESAGSGLSRSCAANGRTCTFEGPATDDFAQRWVQALSYGDMDAESLQGMTMKDFSFYDTEDGLRFSITAKHPGDR